MLERRPTTSQKFLEELIQLRAKAHIRRGQGTSGSRMVARENGPVQRGATQARRHSALHPYAVLQVINHVTGSCFQRPISLPSLHIFTNLCLSLRLSLTRSLSLSLALSLALSLSLSLSLSLALSLSLSLSGLILCTYVDRHVENIARETRVIVRVITHARGFSILHGLKSKRVDKLSYILQHLYLHVLTPASYITYRYASAHHRQVHSCS